MKTKLLISLPFILLWLNGVAQTDLYLPLEFKKAYADGTRQYDGAVSPKYWQNYSDYQIKAKVDPRTKLLTGEAHIVYHNNSPSELKEIVFHGYANFYKKGAHISGLRGDYDPALESDGMVIDLLKAAGETIDTKNRRKFSVNGSSCLVRLTDAVQPGNTVELDINWHFTIPGDGFERCGAIDSTSMFVGYWYPEIAVRDDIDGWDRVHYDGSTEFYHDYSNYQVELEVPDNFIVWASVAPDNPEEVYSAELRKRIDAAKASSEDVLIYGKDDFRTTQSAKTLHWKYTAKDFPDFAFALSDHFNWRAGHYNDAVGGDYFVGVAYPENHPGFAAVVKSIRESLRTFHYDFPVHEFPFHYFTIFNGLPGGGMEYPGMANNAAPGGRGMMGDRKLDDFEASLSLTAHEMCHMYFPFTMGINEKKYGWMDEGWATFSSYFLKYGRMDFEFDRSFLGSQEVCPPMVPTYTQPDVGSTNSYTIGSASYHALYTLLGKDEFSRCLNVYINTWKHKHPTPYDYMLTFNKASGQNLNWFWKRWYFDWGYTDLALKSFDKNVLTITNEGGRPMGFDIIYTYDDKSTETETVSAGVWKDSNVYKKKVKAKKTITAVKIKSPVGADAVKDNNSWKKG